MKLVHPILRFKGKHWGVKEYVVRPLGRQQIPVELYTLESIENPLNVLRIDVETIHSGIQKGAIERVGWIGQYSPEVKFHLWMRDYE